MGSESCLKFLGNRALHASPSKRNLKYGGNSACTVIESGDDVFIFGASFGMNSYGNHLSQTALKSKKPTTCHFFMPDFLWDNTVGFPFFTPLHFTSSAIHVHSVCSEVDAKKWLSGVCGLDFSPFSGLSSFRSSLAFHGATQVHNIGAWQIEALTHTHPLAPYAAAIWTLRHSSGFSVAVSCNGILDSGERNSLSSKLKNFDVLVQAAIAPKLTHPTMSGRFSFTDALSFAVQCEVKNAFISGIHPCFDDSELAQAESRLQEEAGRLGLFAIEIAKEDQTIALASGPHLKRAG